MNTISPTLGAFDVVQHYAPEPPTDAELRHAREMAEEKVCRDLGAFSEFICCASIGPHEREDSPFGLITTEALVTEILMQTRATDEQIVKGWKELRRRYVESEESTVAKYAMEVLA